MRRIGSLFMALTLILSLAACGSTEEGTSGSESSVSVSGQETPASGSTEDAESDADTAETAEETAAAGDAEESSQDSRILVAYYSWADNAVLAEDVDAVASPSVIPPGNVQQLAGWVQEATGGDLFSIQVTDPYPSDWDACLERANQERGDDAARNWPQMWRIWISMMWFSWGTLIGGTACRWRFFHSWSRMIFQEKKYICSVPMEPEGLPTACRSSRRQMIWRVRSRYNLETTR